MTYILHVGSSVFPKVSQSSALVNQRLVAGLHNVYWEQLKIK